MDSLIALFRGINVGGSNKLPMADLRHLLAELGAEDVRTCIQSGNAVFRISNVDPDALVGRIRSAVSKGHGFEPHVMVFPPQRLYDAISDNPFPEAVEAGNSLHLFFLGTEPSAPDLSKIESLKSASERWRLDGDRFYLHAPEGIARSRLATGAEKALGVPVTARNWNTVCRLRDMAREMGDG